MSTRNIAVTLLCGPLGLALAGACNAEEKPSSTSSTGSASCVPTDPACPALGVESACLGLVDNSGQDKFVLRLAQLSVLSPQALTGLTVKKVVGDGVNINLPSCNVPGKGTFSLITEFDLKNGKLSVGGAKPEAKPEDGYCYAYDAAHGVAPVEVDATFTGLAFTTEPIPKIVLPVYIEQDAAQAVYLPVRGAKLSDGTISQDHNCIGSFNGNNLDPFNNCLPDAMTDFFVNGAKLDGYVTLEEADQVVVDLLGQTLCVLLSGDPEKYGDKGMPKKCARSGGKIELEGDWCSTTNSAGGCKDSFRLAAELAASSAKLRSDCPMASSSSAAAGGGMGASGGAGGN